MEDDEGVLEDFREDEDLDDSLDDYFLLALLESWRNFEMSPKSPFSDPNFKMDSIIKRM